jgi:glycosyltransferase involved in cell wall biosynthesis
MTPVVTFINRHLEPLRGFHIFMRALPRLLTTVPDVHVLIIGADRLAGYGPKPPREGVTWKQLMLEELQGQLDGSRVHFVGQLAYDQLMRVLSISRAHVYMTYPFVLSWSLLDAMACECLIIGSDTAPVRDVIRPGKNGLLVDFFDHKALADALTEACVVPDQYEEMRRSARATIVDEFDRKTVCEPAWLSLINEVLSEVSEKFVPRGVSG